MDRLRDAHLRHAEHFLDVLDACDTLYKSGRDGVLRALARFDEERANVVLGQARVESYMADDSRARSLCSRFPDVAALLLPVRLSAKERVRWRTVGLRASRELRDRRLESAHLVGLANAYDDLGDTDRALEVYELALALKGQLGDEAGEARVRINMAIALTRAGKAQEALSHLGPQVVRPPGMLVVGNAMEDESNQGAGAAGAAHLVHGNMEMALAYLHVALIEARCRGDLRKEASVLMDLALAHVMSGAVEPAREELDHAAALARSLGDQTMEGQALVQRGLAEILAGDHAAAEALVEAGRSMLLAAGSRLGIHSALGPLALAAHLGGDLKRAAELYEAAVELARSTSDRGSEAALLEGFAAVLTGLGRPREAIAAHERARSLATKAEGEPE